LVLLVPDRLWELLEEVERSTGIRKEDLVARALIRVVEEFRV